MKSLGCCSYISLKFSSLFSFSEFGAPNLGGGGGASLVHVAMKNIYVLKFNFLTRVTDIL